MCVGGELNPNISLFTRNLHNVPLRLYKWICESDDYPSTLLPLQYYSWLQTLKPLTTCSLLLVVCPVFSGIYQFRVPESSKSGVPVGKIKATDRDIGKNAEMYFTIVSGDGMDMFDIATDKDTQEGVITVSKVRQ